MTCTRIFLGILSVAVLATPARAAQSSPAPSCTEDKRSACWIEADNQPDCQFWHDDWTPSLKVDWSGECSNGLAQGKGTLTWDACFWENGCMPLKVQQSGSFRNGRRQGRWIDGPSDAAGCHRWNTEMYFKAATVEDVTACLKAGADVNAKDRDYGRHTPLHLAVRWNELPMVEILIKAGADLEARHGGGGTPLHEAAWSGDDPAVFQVLLQAGADVNALNNDSNTPLHRLARFNSERGHRSVVIARILIDAGADVNARQDDGYTPLHYAARRGSVPVIEVLIEAGAEVDARNNRGGTPLHEVAWFNESPAAIEELLSAGADPGAINREDETPCDLYRKLVSEEEETKLCQ